MKDDTPDVIAILDDARLEEIIRLRVDNAKLREACEGLLELVDEQNGLEDMCIGCSASTIEIGDINHASHCTVLMAKVILEETK